MQGDIDGGVGGVGEEGAIIEREVGIGIAEDEGGNAATFQFLAKTAGESESYVLFCKRWAEGFAAVGAAVARVYHCKVTAWKGRWISCWRLRGWKVLRRGGGWRGAGGCGGLRLCGSQSDGAAIVAEAGQERDGGGHR